MFQVTTAMGTYEIHPNPDGGSPVVVTDNTPDEPALLAELRRRGLQLVEREPLRHHTRVGFSVYPTEPLFDLDLEEWASSKRGDWMIAVLRDLGVGTKPQWVRLAQEEAQAARGYADAARAGAWTGAAARADAADAAARAAACADTAADAADAAARAAACAADARAVGASVADASATAWAAAWPVAHAAARGATADRVRAIWPTPADEE